MLTSLQLEDLRSTLIMCIERLVARIDFLFSNIMDDTQTLDQANYKLLLSHFTEFFSKDILTISEDIQLYYFMPLLQETSFYNELFNFDKFVENLYQHFLAKRGRISMYAQITSGLVQNTNFTENFDTFQKVVEMVIHSFKQGYMYQFTDSQLFSNLFQFEQTLREKKSLTEKQKELLQDVQYYLSIGLLVEGNISPQYRNNSNKNQQEDDEEEDVVENFQINFIYNKYMSVVFEDMIRCLAKMERITASNEINERWLVESLDLAETYSSFFYRSRVLFHGVQSSYFISKIMQEIKENLNRTSVELHPDCFEEILRALAKIIHPLATNIYMKAMQFSEQFYLKYNSGMIENSIDYLISHISQLLLSNKDGLAFLEDQIPFPLSAKLSNNEAGAGGPLKSIFNNKCNLEIYLQSILAPPPSVRMSRQQLLEQLKLHQQIRFLCYLLQQLVQNPQGTKYTNLVIVNQDILDQTHRLLQYLTSIYKSLLQRKTRVYAESYLSLDSLMRHYSPEELERDVLQGSQMRALLLQHNVGLYNMVSMEINYSSGINLELAYYILKLPLLIAQYFCQYRFIIELRPEYAALCEQVVECMKEFSPAPEDVANYNQ